MKKKCRILTVLLVCMLFVSGCQGGQKLSDAFDEDKVKEAAKEVIELVSAGDYDTLAEDWWGAQVNMMLPAEKMESDIKPVIDELGAFQSFDKEAVTGSTDKDTDQEFATAVMKVKYENRNAQYTISFNKDMKVSGFYIK